MTQGNNEFSFHKTFNVEELGKTKSYCFRWVRHRLAVQSSQILSGKARINLDNCKTEHSTTIARRNSLAFFYIELDEKEGP